MDAIAAPKPRRKRAPKAESIPETSSALDLAMGAATAGKPLPEVARRLLEEQAELLHAQAAEIKLRHFGNRVRAMLWGLLALAAAGLILFLGYVVVKAMRTDALVVESFRVPPAWAQRGVTGEVLAAQMLDRIADMQKQTTTLRAASSYDNNWGDELKIAIPNTGATAEQLWSVLRSGLGKETRISGELVQTPQGLALTTRVGSQAGTRFVDRSGDLDTLIQKAAAAVYRETQPYRYALYLGADSVGQPERAEIMQELMRSDSPVERMWGLHNAAVERRRAGDPAGAMAYSRRVLEMNPDFVPAWYHLANLSIWFGRFEDALGYAERQRAVTDVRGFDAEMLREGRCLSDANVGFWVERDQTRVKRSLECISNARSPTLAYADYLRALAVIVLQHDTSVLNSYRISRELTADDPRENAQAWRGLWLVAALQGRDGAMLAKAYDRFAEARAAVLPTAGPNDRLVDRTRLLPIMAEALVRLGRRREAAALIVTTPKDCYDCLRMRGLVALSLGRTADARRWYGEAIRQGPSLAPAVVDLASMDLRLGKVADAERNAREAVRLAPNWADPHKLLGDVLMAKDEPRWALRQYDAALRFAPRWPELLAARDAAARQLG